MFNCIKMIQILLINMSISLSLVGYLEHIKLKKSLSCLIDEEKRIRNQFFSLGFKRSPPK